MQYIFIAIGDIFTVVKLYFVKDIFFLFMHILFYYLSIYSRTSILRFYGTNVKKRTKQENVKSWLKKI